MSLLVVQEFKEDEVEIDAACNVTTFRYLDEEEQAAQSLVPVKSGKGRKGPLIGTFNTLFDFLVPLDFCFS